MITFCTSDKWLKLCLDPSKDGGIVVDLDVLLLSLYKQMKSATSAVLALFWTDFIGIVNHDRFALTSQSTLDYSVSNHGKYGILGCFSILCNKDEYT